MANETKVTKPKEVKYTGQFAKFGTRKGKLAEAVYTDLKASKETLYNQAGMVAERLHKAGVTKGDVPNLSAVRTVLELMAAAGKVERIPVGNSAAYKVL